MSFANTNVKWTEIGVTEDGRIKLQNDYDGKYRYVRNGTLYNNGTAIVEAGVNTKVSSLTSGATSANTVSGKVVGTISKKDVVRNVVNNAAKYAKYAGTTAIRGRGNVYGIAATLLLDTLNKDPKTGQPLPEGRGYDIYGNGVIQRHEYTEYICLSRPSNPYESASDCFKGSGYHLAYNGFDNSEKGFQLRQKERVSAARMICTKSRLASSIDVGNYYTIESFKVEMSQDYATKGRGQIWCSYTIKSKKTGTSLKMHYETFKFGTANLKTTDWDGNINDDEIEKNLKKWIDAGKDENGDIPNLTTAVVIDNGQVAQTPPYTDENGRAVQTRWDFETIPSDKNGGLGETSVKETTIPRPDLQPNSTEAPPLPKPTSTVSPVNPPKNPDSSDSSGETPSDKEKDKETDGSDEEADNNDDEDAENNDKKQQDVKGLCDEYPNILACEKMGNVEEGFFDDIKIPNITDDRTWQSDNFLPSDGVCPVPKVFHVLGKQFEVSYEPLCELMRKVRFVILIAFILMSAYLVFGSLRKGQ